MAVFFSGFSSVLFFAFLATFHSAANFFTTSPNHFHAFLGASLTGFSIFSSSNASSCLTSTSDAWGAFSIFFSMGLRGSSVSFILNQIFLFFGSRSIIFAFTICHSFTTSFGLLTDF